MFCNCRRTEEVAIWGPGGVGIYWEFICTLNHTFCKFLIDVRGCSQTSRLLNRDGGSKPKHHRESQEICSSGWRGRTQTLEKDIFRIFKTFSPTWYSFYPFRFMLHFIHWSLGLIFYGSLGFISPVYLGIISRGHLGIILPGHLGIISMGHLGLFYLSLEFYCNGHMGFILLVTCLLFQWPPFYVSLVLTFTNPLYMYMSLSFAIIAHLCHFFFYCCCHSPTTT
jgi:hypothetical protein